MGPLDDAPGTTGRRRSRARRSSRATSSASSSSSSATRSASSPWCGTTPATRWRWRDIVQDTFVKAYRKLDTFEHQSSFSTWLHRIAVNTALDFLKRAGRSPVRAVEDLEVVENAAPQGGRSVAAPDSRLEREEVAEITQEVLDELPEIFRTVLVMREFEDMAYQEIADVLGISIGTVESRLSGRGLVSRTRSFGCIPSTRWGARGTTPGPRRARARAVPHRDAMGCGADDGGRELKSCEDVRSLLWSYVDGELSEEQAAPMRAHLLECRTCRESVQEGKVIGRWFRAARPESVEIPQGFAARTARRAFAGDPGLSAPAPAATAARPAGSLVPFVLKLVTAAAAALFAFSLGIQRESLPEGTGMQAQERNFWENESFLEEWEAREQREAEQAAPADEEAPEDAPQAARER